MHNFESLFKFIDRAEHSRYYAPNTAHGLKVALRLFQPVLKPEELASIEKFKGNFEPIYQEVCRKNTKFTAGSLNTYKYRVLRVLDHYEKYGADPSKMVNWKVSARGSGVAKTKTAREKKQSRTVEVLAENVFTPPQNSRRLEYPLSAGQIIILLPQKITAADLKKINTLLGLIEVNE